MKYIVSWSENRSIIIEADDTEQAEEIIKTGNFAEDDVESDGVDMATIEAVKFEK